MEWMAFWAEVTAYANTRREKVAFEERDSESCVGITANSALWLEPRCRGRVVVGCGGSEAAEVCGALDHAGACGFLRGSREAAGGW